MKRIPLGALVGGLTTAALLAILYLANQLVGLPYAPFALFNWITRVLPGDLVTFGIDTMIDLMLATGISVVDAAKTSERLIAHLQVWGIGLGLVAVYFWLGLGKRKAAWWHGLVVGLALGAPLLVVTLLITRTAVALPLIILWYAVAFLAWGFVVSFAASRLAAPQPAAEPVALPELRTVERLDRRQFIIRLGATTAAITVFGSGLASLLATQARRSRTAASGGGTNITDFPNANDPIIPAPGTRPEYTPIPDHYQVFLETEPTVIEEAEWRLPITGMVDNPAMLTLNDFRNNYAARDQFVTLRCISGRVNTGLIGTTLWTGASVKEVLADLGVQEGAKYLYIESGDGFHETVELDLINNDERIMFAYDWDGQPIPVDHGFPLRIWIPDLYGMKQPKWITSIEVTDEYRPGYWVERNWSETARVRTVSDIDTVAVDDLITDGPRPLVPIGGMAYSGDRGISKVEVRVNGGEWQEAQLRTPLSETTWTIWRYDWPFEEGNHTFDVRCFEGDGTPQILELSDNRPDGVTGMHSVDETL